MSQSVFELLHRCFSEEWLVRAAVQITFVSLATKAKRYILSLLGQTDGLLLDCVACGQKITHRDLGYHRQT